MSLRGSRLFLHRADAFNEKVDEKPNPKRNLATECVKRMHRQSVHRQIGKHDDQAARGEVISYRSPEQIDDAGTLKRREALTNRHLTCRLVANISRLWVGWKDKRGS